MIYEHNSYRSYLKNILADRQSKNPAYSLRALARDLGVKPAHLSFVIRAKKGISLQNALKIAKSIGLNSQEIEYFCGLVHYEDAKSPELKNNYLQRLQSLNTQTQIHDLSVDLFRIISDWYHIPILEMLELKDFKFTAINLAQRLGITPIQAEVAIERLMRLELLEKDKKGNYKKIYNNYLFKSEKPNTALQSFHAQMLEKAIRSIKTQGPKEKYIGSQTFSIDVEQLESAREVLDECRKKLVVLFESGKSKTQTYHLGLQLFNLTGGEKK